MIEIKIRPVKNNDLAFLQQLFVETITAICSKDYTNEQIRVWTASTKNTQRWLDLIENQYCILAEINDHIVGFGSLEGGRHIDMLYVHKDFQKKGVATKLYSNLEKKSIIQNQTILTSYVSRTARPFFKKKGFKVLVEQSNTLQGVVILNYKMMKKL